MMRDVAHEISRNYVYSQSQLLLLDNPIIQLRDDGFFWTGSYPQFASRVNHISRFIYRHHFPVFDLHILLTDDYARGR
jgi:hypothetical protein